MRRKKKYFTRKLILKRILLLNVLFVVILSGCNKNNEQWIYQASSGGIIKYDVSGRDYRYISSISAKEVVVNKEWLYYVTEDGILKKNKLNQKQEIQFDPKYLTYKSKKDGKEHTFLNGQLKNEMPPTDEIIINGKESKNIAVSDNVVFFSNMEDKGKLYKINSDGTGLLMISEDVPEQISIDGQWIYYTSVGDFNSIFRLKKDGSAKKQITDDYATWIEASNNWIYYMLIKKDGGKYIYKIKSDGSNKTEIMKDVINEPHVFGDWFYFNNNEGFFKVKTDGSGKEKLS